MYLILSTDGSGHEDGFGGYAAYVKTPDGLVNEMVMGCMSRSSVDRAEFTALIEGLRLAHETWRKMPGSRTGAWPEEVEMVKPHIVWYSDRESLVLSVKRVYARDNCQDLWAAFEYFESITDIEAHYMEEQAITPEFAECDLQSSTGRIIMKSYYGNTPVGVLHPVVKAEKKKKKDDTTAKR